MSQCQRHNPARNNRGLLIDPDGGDLFDDDEVLDCGKPVNFTYYDHLGKEAEFFGVKNFFSLIKATQFIHLIL
jgi:hypothetical protein